MLEETTSEASCVHELNTETVEEVCDMSPLEILGDTCMVDTVKEIVEEVMSKTLTTIAE